MNQYYTEAIEASKLTDEELLILLGQNLPNRNAFPLSKQQLIELARDWLNQNVSEMGQMICTNQKLKNLVGKEEALLVAAIADIIVTTQFGIPGPVTVGMLLLRVGLVHICNEYWK